MNTTITADSGHSKALPELVAKLLSRENPRLCRGDSSSLTFTGVHQGNSTP